VSVKVELENIGHFQGKREFKFKKGLNIIYAPNASGKSSILAGLKVVLTSALTSAELIRALNDYEKRGYVKLSLDEQEYIVKLLRRSDGSVEALGERLIDNGVVKVTSFVDLESQLVNAVYSGKEEDVMKIIREVTGVTYVEKIIAVLSSLETSYGHRYEVERKKYEGAKGEVEDQIREVEARLRRVRDKIIEIQRDPSLEPIRRELNVMEVERRDVEKKLKKGRLRETEISSRLGLVDRDYRELEARFKVLLEDRERLEAERKAIQERLIETKMDIERLEMEIKKLSSERNEMRRELKELEIVLKRRREILAYARCPYCGSEIKREKVLEEIRSIEDRISELSEKLREIEDAIEKKEREIRRLKESTEEKLQFIMREIMELDAQIKDIESRLEKLKIDRKRLKQELEEVKRELELLERERRVLLNRLEQLSDKAPLVKELRKLEDEEGYLSKRLDYLYGRLRQLDALYEEVKILEDRLETTKLLKEYFEERLNELSAIVINKINEEISKHFKLLRLAELEYPVIRRDFTLRIVRTGGTPSSLFELSDAEKTIFIILLTLALKEYVASDFPFYILDGLIELIDEARAKVILDYLKERAGNRFVVIVTKNMPFTGEAREVHQEDIYVNTIPWLR